MNFSMEFVGEKAVEAGQNVLNMLYAAIPSIILAVLIIIIGILIGKITKKVVEKILDKLGMAKATRIAGFDATLKRIGYKGTTVNLVGDLVKVLIYLITLAMAAETLNLMILVRFFQDLTMFLPRIIAAVLVFIIGILLADFVTNFIKTIAVTHVDRKKETNILSLAIFTEVIAKIILYLIILILVLNIIGISAMFLDITYAATLIFVGVLSIFGLKDIVRNFTAGIYLQKRIKTGSYIHVNGHEGTVTEIDSLFTTLQYGKKSVLIPNHMLIKKVIEKEK